MLLEKLEKHNLKISDCRGQSYDNGSKMMCSKQGVQARILVRVNLTSRVRDPLGVMVRTRGGYIGAVTRTGVRFRGVSVTDVCQ